MNKSIRDVKDITEGVIMAGTHFLTNCPRCGYVAEAWSLDGVTVKVCCRMCGYEGWLPNPDLKNGTWRVG